MGSTERVRRTAKWAIRETVSCVNVANMGVRPTLPAGQGITGKFRHLVVRFRRPYGTRMSSGAWTRQ